MAKSVESDGRDIRFKNISGGSNLDFNLSTNQKFIKGNGGHPEDEIENEISPNARYKIIKTKNKPQSGLDLGGSDAGSQLGKSEASSLHRNVRRGSRISSSLNKQIGSDFVTSPQHPNR